jgi:hypothetical protein
MVKMRIAGGWGASLYHAGNEFIIADIGARDLTKKKYKITLAED